MANRLNLHIDESGSQDFSEGQLYCCCRSSRANPANIANPSARRLLQVADYICTVVRVSDDYDAGRQTKTHERFFGNRRSFMQSFKKQLDRKLFN